MSEHEEFLNSTITVRIHVWTNQCNQTDPFVQLQLSIKIDYRSIQIDDSD